LFTILKLVHHTIKDVEKIQSLKIICMKLIRRNGFIEETLSLKHLKLLQGSPEIKPILGKTNREMSNFKK